MVRFGGNARTLMTTMDRPQIEYAPKLPARRRRRVQFVAVRASVVIAAAATLCIFGPSAWNRARLLYWQSKAMRYSPPANLVVYDDDPAPAARRARRDPRFSDSGETTGGYRGGAIRMARPWLAFNEIESPPGRAEAATLFLHERAQGPHAPRMVAVELLGMDGPMSPESFAPGSPVIANFSVSVVRPGSAIASPTVIGDRIVRLSVGAHRLKDHFRCFAGQIDPADESHFTIAYQLNGQPAVLDGWLLDDDTVRLQRRPPTR